MKIEIVRYGEREYGRTEVRRTANVYGERFFNAPNFHQQQVVGLGYSGHDWPGKIAFSSGLKPGTSEEGHAPAPPPKLGSPV